MQKLLNCEVFFHLREFLLVEDAWRVEERNVFDLFWFYEQSEGQLAAKGEIGSLWVVELLGRECVVEGSYWGEAVH